MALKIRCQGCSKKISIDEAFAGGVCRCPYCKALTLVPGGETGTAPAARPDRPDRPGGPLTTAAPSAAVTDRPASPLSRPAAPTQEHLAAQAGHHEVPVARPVLIQGVVTLVLIGLFVVLMAFAAVMWYQLTRKPPTKPDSDAWNSTMAPARKNPIVEQGVAGVFAAPPVVFVLDGGASMESVFGLAREFLDYTVWKLEGNFNIVVPRSEKVQVLSESGWVAGGKNGSAKAREFFPVRAAGVSDLNAALEKALALSPRSVVLVTAKGIEAAQPIVDKAKAGGIQIHVVALDSSGEDAKSLQDLAEKTGGKYTRYAASELGEYLEKVEKPPQD